MNTNFYTITTKSNTHVGSGQNSYGIVDNVVQRDYLLELPCMNSTSLKGALREYAEAKKWTNIESIFGSKPNEKDSTKLLQGSHYFNQAYLLSFPMRSNKLQYFNVTCPALLEHLKNNLPANHALIQIIETLLAKDEIITINTNQPISDVHDNFIVEKHSIITKKVEITFDATLKSVLGNNLLVMHNDTYKSLVKKLPIITSNQLENGQSANLFYEEVVPRETVFGCRLQANEIDSFFDNIPEFQIGANATVGYGFCSLKKI